MFWLKITMNFKPFFYCIHCLVKIKECFIAIKCRSKFIMIKTRYSKIFYYRCLV